jgi:hypothetical protein
MQSINRIQNVTTIANATITGAMVVSGTNAHRAVHSLKPCDPSLFKKASDPESRSTSPKWFKHLERCSPYARRGSDLAGNYAAEGMWRMQSRYTQMPANINTAPVFQRS